MQYHFFLIGTAVLKTFNISYHTFEVFVSVHTKTEYSRYTDYVYIKYCNSQIIVIICSSQI